MKKFNVQKLIIFTDGAARGNPGPAAAAAVIKNDQGTLVAKVAKYLQIATNNQAEYQAVLLGLEKAKELGAEEVDFYLDSELVVSQLNREYKVKDLSLQSFFVKIWNLSNSFKKITYHHVPREENREADKLANLKLDEVLKIKPSSSEG
ncbi:ribonuclease HI family protein [Patescibacteria group bacterium]|nr:ribonuclease HI family protein [Patescibacteria group bacterium]